MIAFRRPRFLKNRMSSFVVNRRTARLRRACFSREGETLQTRRTVRQVRGVIADRIESFENVGGLGDDFSICLIVNDG